MDKEYHKSHALASKHMVDSNRKMTRIAKIICASGNASEVKEFIDELAKHKLKEKELVDRFSQLSKGMGDVVNGDDLVEQKRLLSELESNDAKLLDGFDYFGLDTFMNRLKISISEKEPVAYKGFVIKVKRVSTYYVGYSIYKDGKKVDDSGNNDGWDKYDDAVKYAKKRIDEYFSNGDDKKALDVMNSLGISEAYYDVIAYDYKGDANPQKTRHMLKDSDNALEELVGLMARNGITDASKISVVKKDRNAQWVNERYDSASYEIYKGWRIVLKIGNGTWEWGVR